MADEKKKDAQFFECSKDNAIADKNRLRLEKEALECVQEENDTLRSANFAANKAAESYEQAYDDLCKALQDYGCGNSVCKVNLIKIMAKVEVRVKKQPKRKAFLR